MSACFFPHYSSPWEPFHSSERLRFQADHSDYRWEGIQDRSYLEATLKGGDMDKLKYSGEEVADPRDTG